MIRSLFLSMQELNKGARRPPNVPPTKVKKLAVIGAGFMGASVGYVSARAGIDVVLIDRDQESADKGKGHAKSVIDDLIKKGRAKESDRDAILGRISATADYNVLKDCDLVIEAVFEDRKVKAETYAKAQPLLKSDAIFASNTSTLPINSLAEEFKDQGKFIGIHFFSPVEKMMLVEIIVGKNTGDVALATALDYVRVIGKTPIVVNDSRGFFANRCVMRYIAEGNEMLLEGVPPAMIENTAQDGRHAGRAAVAVGRSGARSRAQDHEGDRSRSRPQRHQSGPEEADGRAGREAGPLRPQERQGLLRLSREGQGPEVAVGGPCPRCSRSISTLIRSTSRN